MPKVRFPIRKRTFEAIAAAQNDLFVGYVGFGISKRKQLVGADFVALTGHRGLIRCSAIGAVAANCGVGVKRVDFVCV